MNTENTKLSLPFITDTAKDDLIVTDYWSMPATGGYTGGCMTGKAAARLLLQELRGATLTNELDDLLPKIMESMLDHASTRRSAGREAHLAARSQVMGFAQVIGAALKAFAQSGQGYYLEAIAPSDLRESYWGGLFFGEDQFVEHLLRLSERKPASRGKRNAVR